MIVTWLIFLLTLIVVIGLIVFGIYVFRTGATTLTIPFLKNKLTTKTKSNGRNKPSSRKRLTERGESKLQIEDDNVEIDKIKENINYGMKVAESESEQGSEQEYPYTQEGQSRQRRNTRNRVRGESMQEEDVIQQGEPLNESEYAVVPYERIHKDNSLSKEEKIAKIMESRKNVMLLRKKQKKHLEETAKKTILQNSSEEFSLPTNNEGLAKIRTPSEKDISYNNIRKIVVIESGSIVKNGIELPTIYYVDLIELFENVPKFTSLFKTDDESDKLTEQEIFDILTSVNTSNVTAETLQQLAQKWFNANPNIDETIFKINSVEVIPYNEALTSIVAEPKIVKYDFSNMKAYIEEGVE